MRLLFKSTWLGLWDVALGVLKLRFLDGRTKIDLSFCFDLGLASLQRDRDADLPSEDDHHILH